MRVIKTNSIDSRQFVSLNLPVVDRRSQKLFRNLSTLVHTERSRSTQGDIEILISYLKY